MRVHAISRADHHIWDEFHAANLAHSDVYSKRESGR